MSGRLLRIVGLVLLAVTVALVVSPWFDFQPATLRKSHRAIAHFSFAVLPFLSGALPVSVTILTKLPMLQSHPTYDIVARDCARLC